MGERDWAQLQKQPAFPAVICDKEPSCQWRRHKRCRFDHSVRKIPWRRTWQPTSVFSPGEFHGKGSVVTYSSRGCRVRHDWSVLACTHTPDIAWVSGTLQPRAGCGSLYWKLHGSNSGNGRFCLIHPIRSLAEGRAGWSSINWGMMEEMEPSELSNCDQKRRMRNSN